VPKLDAFGIVVGDLARSVAFYRRLGLDFGQVEDSHGHAEAEIGGGIRYMLDTEETIHSFDPAWKRPTDGHLHAGAFRCESADEVNRLYAELLDAGASPHKEPWDAFWGQRYAQLRDPDGNVIDLYAPL
jgi:catechol 2,3-dioxygenase-like lactoylglutathione lyase family enzyme